MVKKNKVKMNGAVNLQCPGAGKWSATQGKVPGMNIEQEGRKLSKVYGMQMKIDLFKF